MDSLELRESLSKLEAIEGRTFTDAEVEAWHEILGTHTADDVTAAALAFHSKPYKRPAFPGDLKAYILEAEGLRLRRCGTVEPNDADFSGGVPCREARGRVRRLVATGAWSAADYRQYKRSGLSTDEFLKRIGAATVG